MNISECYITVKNEENICELKHNDFQDISLCEKAIAKQNTQYAIFWLKKENVNNNHILLVYMKGYTK